MCENKIRNWRIVAGILMLLLVQAALGRMDSEARLEEAERVAQLHGRAQDGAALARPPAALQRQACPEPGRRAAIGNTCGGLL